MYPFLSRLAPSCTVLCRIYTIHVPFSIEYVRSVPFSVEYIPTRAVFSRMHISCTFLCRGHLYKAPFSGERIPRILHRTVFVSNGPHPRLKNNRASPPAGVLAPAGPFSGSRLEGLVGLSLLLLLCPCLARSRPQPEAAS